MRQVDAARRWGDLGGDAGRFVTAVDDLASVALRDDGDKVRIAWERKDLQLRGRPAQTAGDTGYVVSPIGDALNLVTFDTRTGTTVASAVLPGAQGTTTGTSVGQKGEVVVTSRVGQIYVFKPET